MVIEIRSADGRYRTTDTGRETRHSFSFGPHYDPANVGFAALMALNDDLLAPGAGYELHHHADLEIVTWVVDGGLLHGDADGVRELGPGALLRTSAGTGIWHSEIAGDRQTRFIQTWLRPDCPAQPPSTAQAEMGEGWTTVDLGVDVTGSSLALGRVTEPISLPQEPLLHIFVAEGAATIEGIDLGSGDAARLTDHGGVTMRGTPDALVAVWGFSG